MRLNVNIIIVSLLLLYACAEKKSEISLSGKIPLLAFSENIGYSSHNGE